MYKISVPVYMAHLNRQGRDRILEEVKKLGAQRIFLWMESFQLCPEDRKTHLETLKDHCDFFRRNGLEVGAWTEGLHAVGNHSFTWMELVEGGNGGSICPGDPDFVEFAAGYIADIARCGVEIIMFEDSMRYGARGQTPACLCEHHLKMIHEITGENLTREELAPYILSGAPNKYRDAYLKANGDAMRKYAMAMRAAVDSVDPAIRLGTCTCLNSWEIDGVEAKELARLFAGNTKPFARLIAAPYWAAGCLWGDSVLQDVVEFSRMESAWTDKDEIELIAEGDAYPRPRLLCPASYLEGFDTAIRASGCTDGILKYGIDYMSHADYETGYARMHQRNLPLYEKIDAAFAGKQSCGVRIYEYPHKAAHFVLPTQVNDELNLDCLLYSQAARVLAQDAIPTVYEGDGVCGTVFDESARQLPLEAADKGLILDAAAAEILTKRGLDVGICAMGTACPGGYARFVESNNCIIADERLRGGRPTIGYNSTLHENAQVLAELETDKGTIPMIYRYESAKGQRFLVLNVNTRKGSLMPLHHYETSRLIQKHVEWLGGQKLPAYTYGHPCMYVQSKEKDGKMAVGLWNFFADIAMEPVVELGQKYENIRFVQGQGRLDGDKVYLEDIPAYGFAGFEVW